MRYNQPRVKYVWSDVAKAKYYVDTGVLLQSLLVNVQRLDDSSLDVDWLYESVVSTLRSCKADYLKSFRSDSKVAWSPHSTQLKFASKDAKSLWLLQGCPFVGQVWEGYLSCKRQYKAAVREQKRRKKDVCVDKLVSAFTAGNDADFWKYFNCECRVNYRHSCNESSQMILLMFSKITLLCLKRIYRRMMPLMRLCVVRFVIVSLNCRFWTLRKLCMGLRNLMLVIVMS